MKVQPLNITTNPIKLPNFQQLHVMDPKTQKLLLTTLDNKQLEKLAGFVKEQENNSVHILLGSKNGKQLYAFLRCDYRIKNYKDKYKQIPILESKFHFIKRVVNTANKYREQIKDFKPKKLDWMYSVLPEWKDKVLL